jgi:hypothetical protein
MFELISGTEGVATAPKDYNLPQHPQIETKNLYVRAYYAWDFVDNVLIGNRSSRLFNR